MVNGKRSDSFIGKAKKSLENCNFDENCCFLTVLLVIFRFLFVINFTSSLSAPLLYGLIKIVACSCYPEALNAG